MSLKDSLEGVLPPYLEIFRPLVYCRKKPVFIATWNLTDPADMAPILTHLMLASKVQLLVGYSKNFHHRATLEEVLKFYRYDMKWDVRVIPNCHCKIWTVGSKAYVGSANFVPNTCYNVMAKVDPTRITPIIKKYWKQATQVSKTTNLAMIPQFRDSDIAQVV